MNRRQSSRNFLQIDTPDRAACDVYRRCGPSAADPAILAQFSFVAAATEWGGVGVFWGMALEFDNAVPPPAGTGTFTTLNSGGEPLGYSLLDNLPGASECSLRIEIFQNGELLMSNDLTWNSGAGQHISGPPAPVPAMMVDGESYTGLIRQLPCPP